MKYIDVYSDPYKRITLRQYGENRKKDIVLKNDDVYSYLSQISNDKLEDFNLVQEGESGYLEFATTKAKVRLLDLNKLDDFEKPLTTSLYRVFKEIEKNQIKEQKNNRSTPIKVTRKNKYTNVKIKASSFIIAGAVLAGIVTSNLLKTEGYANSNDTVDIMPYEQYEDYENNDIDSSFTFEDMDVNYQNQDTYDLAVDNNVVEVETEYRGDTDKGNRVKELYGNLITEYANRYGIDPKIMIAIATQERGEHSSVMDDGGATGIMQMQNSVWLNKEIKAYNYETNSMESFTVKQNMIESLEVNVQLGCMYFQNCLDYMDYNIPAAIQCYNMGVGNMNTILNAYAYDQGCTKEEILSNPNDTGWTNYRYLSPKGDKMYLENVTSWLDKKENISVINRHNNNEPVNITFENKEVNKAL